MGSEGGKRRPDARPDGRFQIGASLNFRKCTTRRNGESNTVRAQMVYAKVRSVYPFFQQCLRLRGHPLLLKFLRLCVQVLL